MVIKAIYHAGKPILKICHKRKVIFQATPVVFQVIEDGKLIILGAHSVVSAPEGLYLDCAPEWTYPVQNGNVLRVEQVYSATQSGNVLRVE